MPKIIGGFAKDVASFFISYRFLNMLSMVNVICFSGLYYQQIWGPNSEEINPSKICGYLPCFVLYSGFNTKLGLRYATNIFFFLLIGNVSSLSRWIFVAKEDQKQQLYQDQNFPISKMIFNSWQWDFKTKQQRQD